MSGFDREKWRAELDSRGFNSTKRPELDVIETDDALTVAERAYAEGRADGACEVIEMARRTAAARGTP